MNRAVESYFFDCKPIKKEQTDKILNILKDSNSYLTHDNELLRIYEPPLYNLYIDRNSMRRVSYVFIFQDNIDHCALFQSVREFALRNNIELYKFPKGTSKDIKKICNKKTNVNIIATFEDDPITVEIKKMFRL
ncbi:hypothetical protein CWI36_1026p0020 [Hamiltosporidium magnivora]|uniref:Uncharacterized protein n=1 Tax=Hamiltosporidium magnivora TaxID=148818 RepID=A0A4Q9L5N8_9MICR|nr:hypothetical protein CWI36_1026p0020 [Hamiltosporidium magnivora]